MADNNRGSGEAFRRRQEARKRREPQTIDAKAEDVTTSPIGEPSDADDESRVAAAEEGARPDVTAFEPGGTAASTTHPDGISAVEPDLSAPDRFGSAASQVPHRDTGLDPAAPEPLDAAPTEHMGDPAKVSALGDVQDPLASGEPVPLADFVRAADETALQRAEPLADSTLDNASSQPLRTPIIDTGPASDVVPTSEATVEGSERADRPEPADAGSPSWTSEALSSGVVRAPEMPDVVHSREAGASDVSGPPPRSTPPERRRSFIPAALAALAAFIVAGLAGIYYGQQLVSGDMAQKLDALNQRVASLEARPEPLRPTVDLGALQSRSESLGSDVGALKAALADLTGKLDQVTQTAAANAARIGTLEQHASAAPGDSKAPEVAGGPAPPAVPTPATPPTIAAPPETSPSADTSSGQPPAGSAETPPAAPAVAAAPAAAPAPAAAAGANADIAALTGQVDDLSKRLAALPTEPPPPVDLTPLQGRIAELAKGLDAEKAVVAGLPRVDQAALDSRLAGIEHKVDQTSNSVDAVTQSVTALPKIDLAPLQASIAAVDQRLVPVEAALSAPKAGDRVTEARAVGSGDESRAAPLAVVAGAIARALDNGQPFGPELDALHGLGLDDAALGPLPALAAPGAPTAGTLRDRWSDIQPKVLTAAGPKTGDSMLDRFAAGARNLVQVRQVGASPDDDPSAASANIGAALDRGDIADALTEWAKLPEASRTASQSWADAARSRLDADNSVQALMSRAIAALVPAKN